MKMRLIDGFETKKQAQDYAKALKAQKVQYVRIRPLKQGRIKYGVYVGGKNSSYY